MFLEQPTLADLHHATAACGIMKHAVITGGAGDLAQAISGELIAADWRVFSPGREELDVTDSNSVRGYFENRRVDLLVCNAGVIRDGFIGRVDDATWREVMEVNYHGAERCAAAVMPGMCGNGGHVLFVSSYSAIHPPAGQTAYATAKAALLGLTADLAKAYGPNNIRVNAILPGFLETKMTTGVSEKRRAEVLAAHSLARFNTVTEVARFVRFLEEELPHTSGQIFQLDSR